jgi:hypothetical protein
VNRPKPINTVLPNGRVERRYYSDTQSDELIAYMDQQDTAVKELREALSSWVAMCHDGYDPEPSAEFVEECHTLIAKHIPPEDSDE